HAMTKSLRLLGFERVTLEPHSSHPVKLIVDPRLLASFDVAAGQWRIEGGAYEITLSQAAGAPGESATVTLQGRLFGK
ncbi:MAG TPA: fibronectin type III-like domain-contianing protein, partial [Steroidobacteraceae bacterium]|nr:fibronectin type III-like domain-contianing protein [Steroidobacteraceae bacterium]